MVIVPARFKAHERHGLAPRSHRKDSATPAQLAARADLYEALFKVFARILPDIDQGADAGTGETFEAAVMRILIERRERIAAAVKAKGADEFVFTFKPAQKAEVQSLQPLIERAGMTMSVTQDTFVFASAAPSQPQRRGVVTETTPTPTPAPQAANKPRRRRLFLRRRSA